MMHYKRAAALAVALFAVITLWVGGANAQTSTTSDGVTARQIGSPLHHPWGMAQIDDDHVLVTERRGRLLKIALSTGATTAINNLPPVLHRKQGGLLDVAIADGWIYLCYAAPVDGNIGTTAIYRGRLQGERLTDGQQIFISNNPTRSGHHFGCRLAVPAHGPHQGYLFASIGDRGDRANAQDPRTHAGAIIRLHLDGRIPGDNPVFQGGVGGLYTIGHRNPQGMAIHPKTGALWTHEHGPRGGDEINLITPGANYGWPAVSFGREYVTRRRVSPHDSLPGYVDPLWVWVPSIAPSGMAFYPASPTEAPFANWRGHLLVGSLKFRQLYLVTLDSQHRPIAETTLLHNSIGRIRDVRFIPNGPFAGLVLVLTDESQGGLYLLQPAS